MLAPQRTPAPWDPRALPDPDFTVEFAVSFGRTAKPSPDLHMRATLGAPGAQTTATLDEIRRGMARCFTQWLDRVLETRYPGLAVRVGVTPPPAVVLRPLPLCAACLRGLCLRHARRGDPSREG
jgi:hypothetical protein